ncbi:MAG: EamA family transporter [Bacteroidetes bacterium]|nr:EamA family transporter [Bacteroidota bacterium]
MNNTAKGYIALLVTSIVWGTTWVASRVGIDQLPALQMAYIRQFIAGLSFVLFYIGVKKYSLPTMRQFRWITVMAILMFVSANGLSTWSLKYIPTGLSCLIGALYPLCVVIIEKVFFKSKELTMLTFIGLFLGITGIGIVFYEHSFQGINSRFFIGVGLSVIAMLSWALGTVFLSRNKESIDPYYGTGWQMLISAVILFFITRPSSANLPLSAISFKTWMIILYLVIFGSLIAFAAFIYSMKTLPAAIASLYAYFNPLVAMVLASFVVGEKLTVNLIWGAIVTLAGVYLVNYSIKRKTEKVIAEPEQ